jgi:hypothetical protein
LHQLRLAAAPLRRNGAHRRPDPIGGMAVSAAGASGL